MTTLGTCLNSGTMGSSGLVSGCPASSRSWQEGPSLSTAFTFVSCVPGFYSRITRGLLVLSLRVPGTKVVTDLWYVA